MKMRRFRTRTKILLLIASIVVMFIGFITIWLIPSINQIVMDRTIEKLENLVEIPSTVIEKYINEYQLGNLTQEEALKMASDEIRVYRYGDNDYFFINSFDGYSVMHSVSPDLEGAFLGDTEDANGVRLFEVMTNVAKNEGKGIVKYLWPKPGSDVAVEKLSYVVGYPQWEILVGTGLYIDDIREIQVVMLRNVLIVSGLVVIVSVALAVFMATTISKPLEKLNHVAKSITEGDLDVELDLDGKDEVADLSRSFSSIRETVKQVIHSANELDLTITSGHLTERANEDGYKGGWLQLIQGINSIANTLEGHIRKVPAVIMALDTDYNVLYLNDAGLSLSGKESRDDVREMKCYDIFKTEHCHTSDCACSQAMKTQSSISSETVANPNGVRMDISYEGTPLLDKSGKVIGAFELVSDQTAVKEAARIQAEQAKIQAREAKIKAKQSEFQSAEVQKLISALEKLAQGQLRADISVSEVDSDTEVLGESFEQIYGSLKTMVKAIRSYIDETSAILDQLASRNLDVEIRREYMGDFAQMRESINTFTNALNGIFTEMGLSSKEIAAGANEVSGISQSLSAGSTQQASSIEEITASMGEVSSQTRKNAERASKAEKLAVDVKTQSEIGQKQMNEMLVAMEAINKSSNEISNIIKVIDEIAFQTNILALNAAVEAARAGEHGKGFAVVAEEVRNLAARSANAASETTQMIEDSISKVHDGASIADKTAEALKEITGGVEQVNRIISDITLASSNQAQAITQINDGVSQISDVTQLNAETAQRGAAASEEMAAQADLLQETVMGFKLKGSSGTRNQSMQYQTYSIEKHA